MPRRRQITAARRGWTRADVLYLEGGTTCGSPHSFGDPPDEKKMRAAWSELRGRVYESLATWNHSRGGLVPGKTRLARMRPFAFYVLEAPGIVEPPEASHFGQVLETDDGLEGEYEYLARIGALTTAELRAGAELRPLPDLELAFKAELANFHRRHCTARDDGTCVHGYPAFGSTLPGADLEWTARYPRDPWNLFRLGEPTHE